MSERPLQAADVYNATQDIRLYEWVAKLEARAEAMEEVVEAASVFLSIVTLELPGVFAHTSVEKRLRAALARVMDGTEGLKEGFSIEGKQYTGRFEPVEGGRVAIFEEEHDD